jgi:hypothetical protein
MAALRAKTIHNITSINNLILRFEESCLTAKKKPVSANGKAKMVCSNLTSLE